MLQKDDINSIGDMIQIVSFHLSSSNGGKIPCSVRRRIAKSFDKFDHNQLIEYKSSGSVRLRDVIKLTHPRPTINNFEALRQIVTN